MAIVVTSNPVNGLTSFSLGPVKIELASFTAANTDTSVVVTAKHLSRVDAALILGCTAEALPAISGLTATITVASAGAKAGYVLLIGK